MEARISRKLSNKLDKMRKIERDELLNLLKPLTSPFHLIRSWFRGDWFVTKIEKSNFYCMDRYPCFIVYAEVPTKKRRVILVTGIYKTVIKKPVKPMPRLKHI